MTVSANPEAAKITLSAMKLIKEKLGAKTILGVSNVSFGLPQRDILNSRFLAFALSNGLNAAIANPFSAEIMKTVRSFNALTGKDYGFSDYPIVRH